MNLEDDSRPLLIGIATNEKAANAIVEASCNEFDKQVSHFIKSCPANAFSVNNQIFIFDKEGKIINEKMIASKNNEM